MSEPETSSNPDEPTMAGPPRRRLMLGAMIGGLFMLLLGLSIPEGDPEVSEEEPATPFVWGQQHLWERLERDFDQARAEGCEEQARLIHNSLANLGATLSVLESRRRGSEDALWNEVEGQLFELTPHLGACSERVPELMALISRMRRIVKDQSRAWDPNARQVRDRLYRLLYGSRAALEELLLQMPEDEMPTLMLGVDESSQTPATVIEGVTLHSGDILVSRGGAPTSAFIARGNDYPGNFSHIALLHVSEAGVPTVIESHIERGVVPGDAEAYLRDIKLRIMVLRMRADHPAIVADPMLPHRAAEAALERARAGHIPYDFAMDGQDESALFCSEVAALAYRDFDVTLWQGLSTMSSPGLRRWLGGLGVTHFRTLGPSDLEYDPSLRVVAEFRGSRTLMDDHIDNAILDVLLERAEEGQALGYDRMLLPLSRLMKAYSVALNLFGGIGPIPEGMSAQAGLHVRWVGETHRSIADAMDGPMERYRQEHGRRPPYWTLVEMARSARDEVVPH